MVSLPPDCIGPHPNSRSNRRMFIKSERQKLNTSEVRVHHYTLQMNAVCFKLQPRYPKPSTSYNVLPEDPLEQDSSDTLDRTSGMSYLENRSRWRNSTSHSPSRDSEPLSSLSTHIVGGEAGSGESRKDITTAHKPSLDQSQSSTNALNIFGQFRSGIHTIKSVPAVKSERITTSIQSLPLVPTPDIRIAERPVIAEIRPSQQTLCDKQPSLDKPSESIVRSSPLSDTTIVEPHLNSPPNVSPSRPGSVEQDYGPYDTVGKRMRFPLDTHDSLRRLVSSPSLSMMFCISMYGAIHEVTCQNPRLVMFKQKVLDKCPF